MKYTVNLQFELLVELCHLVVHAVAKRAHLLQVQMIAQYCVDHDAVRVAIDHVGSQRVCGHVDCMLQHVLSLVCHGEAEVVLLNDAGVETVKDQEQHKQVIEALFGFQNKAASELGVPTVVLVTVSAPYLAKDTLTQHHILERMKLVQQKPLVAMGMVSAEGGAPLIACNDCELLREGQHLQLER